MEPMRSIQSISAWRCTGCGRIEAPQPCLGVCHDEAVELVSADEFNALRERYRRVARDNARMRALLVRIRSTRPRPAGVQATWVSAQRQAQTLLSEINESSP